ncbi:MAG: NADH:flavin oxidoreductase [Planctomycetes bacterium]|nr:NADH:flavin oxidoreductase [Planctomycetota bacterium]
MTYPRISTLKSAADFQRRLTELGIHLPFDEELQTGPLAPLAQPLRRERGVIGNRFSILPMEGWDGTTDGRPTDLTLRRWGNFGKSGAKLIWGGEAVAVRPNGRANPNQLILNTANESSIAGLRDHLLEEHRRGFGTTDDLLIGLQLTHSGRFARPNDKKKLEPRIAYRHPVLDAKFGIADDKPLLSDDEISVLIDDFVVAAKRAAKLGFAFVDVKHCHGYLGHEFLSAFDRPGKFGGSLENRTRFLREITAGIRAEAPGLEIGVRVSIFDFIPFKPGPDGIGTPALTAPYHLAFGGDGTGLGIDLDEPHRFLQMLTELDIELVCISAGSPYYVVTVQLKASHPKLIFVGTGYSYLQEWLPHVGQRLVRDGGVDFVGLGRMVLSYPELPADVLAGKGLERKRICRTFSDCTTAPRNGMVSGCYPLDPFYKERPERVQLNAVKGK